MTLVPVGLFAACTLWIQCLSEWPSCLLFFIYIYTQDIGKCTGNLKPLISCCPPLTSLPSHMVGIVKSEILHKSRLHWWNQHALPRFFCRFNMAYLNYEAMAMAGPGLCCDGLVMCHSDCRTCDTQKTNHQLEPRCRLASGEWPRTCWRLAAVTSSWAEENLSQHVSWRKKPRGPNVIGGHRGQNSPHRTYFWWSKRSI